MKVKDKIFAYTCWFMTLNIVELRTVYVSISISIYIFMHISTHIQKFMTKDLRIDLRQVRQKKAYGCDIRNHKATRMTRKHEVIGIWRIREVAMSRRTQRDYMRSSQRSKSSRWRQRVQPVGRRTRSCSETCWRTRWLSQIKWTGKQMNKCRINSATDNWNVSRSPENIMSSQNQDQLWISTASCSQNTGSQSCCLHAPHRPLAYHKNAINSIRHL